MVARTELARLAADGVTPRDILDRLCAVWLFFRRNPFVLPDDARLTDALSASTLTLAPFSRKQACKGGERVEVSRRILGPHRRDLGVTIRESIGPPLHNVADRLDRRTLRGDDARAVMRQSFTSTNT